MDIEAARAFWDQQFGTEDYAYGRAPNDFLRDRFDHIPKGKVLCLADGEGRNAVFLAEQGYQVTSVDISPVGLEKAQRLAAERGVTIETRCADLRAFDLGHEQWQGIVSISCHLPSADRRGLHQRVVEALAPEGVLLLEAYTPRQLDFGTGGPPTADAMMTAVGLTEELAPLRFAHLEELEREVVEGRNHTGHAAVVQALAVRDAG